MNQRQSINQWVGKDIGNGDSSRYHIQQLIGSGGSGEVFVAIDNQNQLGRRVAIKILRHHLNHDSKMRKHFEREVSLCTSIKSEHVVMVSDFGITKQGYPFYVMELLEGKTLRQFIREQGQLPWQEVKQLALQICEGLEHAHRGVNLFNKGTQSTELVKVIHCDLKPDNIFLIPTGIGLSNFVKILDFGIAKLRLLEEDTNATVPISGGFWGTFRYAAPEQLEESNYLDERADIYSLGIMLYEMLSGTDPFGLGSGDTTAMTWVLAHTTTPPIPLRQCRNCESVPRSLEAIVMRCIEKKLTKRIGSVTDLKAALMLVSEDDNSLIKRKNKKPPFWRISVTISAIVILNIGLGFYILNKFNIEQYVKELRELHRSFRYKECVDYTDKLSYNPLPQALLRWRDRCLLDWAADLGGRGLFEEAFSQLNLISKNSDLKNDGLEKINLFSETILQKGERDFQNGKWELAVLDTKQIPASSNFYDQAQLAIQRWQSESDQARELYDKARLAYQQKKWLEVIDASYCFPKIEKWQAKMAPLVADAESALAKSKTSIPKRVCTGS